jgi:hypothetical protein
MVEKKDILERLRAGCQFGPDYEGDPESWICHRIECEAANEIEMLRKEVTRLRAFEKTNEH